jgi:regulator of protease activity HflC (stomatin/prohibitin superfamily)
MVIVAVVIALVLVALAGAALSVRILKQYERAVVFRLGRVNGGARGPGLIAIVPFVDRIHRVSLRIVTMPIQSQGIITRDNVSVDVSAVAYYRVADAVQSVVAIENVAAAINQIAQTTLRAVVGVTRSTRRSPRPRRSTRTSARSSMSRPRSGVSMSRSSS